VKRRRWRVQLPILSFPFHDLVQVAFKVNADGTSPLTFVALVWKDEVQLQTATPVQVTVTSKSG